MSDSNDPKPLDTPARRRSKKKLILMGLGALVAILILALAGARLYYNDDYIRKSIEQALSYRLRRPCSIDNLEAGIFSGTARLEGIHIQNASADFQDFEMLRLKEVRLAASFWTLATSSGKNIKGLKLELQQPEFIVERREKNGAVVTNLDDLIAKLLAGPPGTWPKETGLQQLAFDLAVHDGTVRFRDPATKLGESRIENLELSAVNTGLGHPTECKISFKLVTPQTPEGGRFEAGAGINWIDAQGRIDPRQFKDLSLDATLTKLDLPFLTRHMGLSVALLNNQLEATLGKPVSGTLKLRASDPANTSVEARLETDGLVSLWEKGVWKAGRVPARIEMSGEGGWKGPALQLRQMKATLVLAQTPAADGEGLNLAAAFSGAEGRAPTIDVKLHGNLNELFSTDVGALLGLKDKMGGVAMLEANAQPDAQGRWKTTGNLTTEGAYVQLNGVRQPTTAHITYDVLAALDAAGNPENSTVNFTCKTGSLEVASTSPIIMTGLNRPAEIAAQGAIRYHADGRRFWKEFGPLLAVFNLGHVMEEELQGDLSITGSAGKVQFGLKGTLKHQSEPASPLNLSVESAYDGNAFIAAAGKPYLNFKVHASLQDEKALNLNLAGNVNRIKDMQFVELTQQDATGDLAALNGLMKCLGAYAPQSPASQMSARGTYQLTGHTKAGHDLRIAGEALDPDFTHFAVFDNADIDGSLKLTDFKLYEAPKAEGGAPLAVWSEDAEVHWNMMLSEMATGKFLRLNSLHGESASLSFDCALGDMDLRKLQASSIPKASLAFQAKMALLAPFKSCGCLPPDLPLGGTVSGKMVFENLGGSLLIESLKFDDPSGDSALIDQLEITGEIADVQKLAVNPFTDLATLTPHLAKGIKASMKVDSNGLLQFLKKRNLGGTATDEALAGVYAIKNLTFTDVAIIQGNEPGTLNVSFTAQSDFSHHPRKTPQSRPSTEAQASMSGVWKLDPASPLHLNLNAGKRSVDATLNLDATELHCAAAAPYIYHKRAGEPCKLLVAAAETGEGGMDVRSVQFTGGPLGLNLSGLQYRVQNGKPFISLKEAALTEPFSCKLNDVSLDMEKDHLHFAWSLAEFSISKLAPYLSMPKSLQAAGGLQDAIIEYDGRISAFSTGITAVDKLTLRVGMKDLGISSAAAAQPVSFTLNGKINADLFRLASEGLLITQASQPPGEAISKQEILFTPQISGKDGLPLADAARREGLPVAASVAIESKASFDVLKFIEALNALSGASPPGQASNSGDMSGIRNLRVEIPTLRARELVFGNFALSDVLSPATPIRAQDQAGIVLDKLVANVSSFRAGVYGGEALVTAASYDLSRIPLQPIQHLQTIKLTGLNLALLAETPEKPADGTFAIAGHMGAAGQLAGAGFNKPERRSWNGALTVSVPDLVARKVGANKTEFSKVGIGLAGALLGGTTGEGMRLYSEDFGLDLSRLEFEPLEVKVTIKNGRAQIEHGSLKARGANAGLRIDFEGSIDLATETFAPSLALWPAELPRRTQELMDLPRLSEQDRRELLKDFSDGVYKAEFKGSVSDPKTSAITMLTDIFKGQFQPRMSRLLEGGASPSRATETPPPAKNTETTPARKAEAPPAKSAEAAPPKKTEVAPARVADKRSAQRTEAPPGGAAADIGLAGKGLREALSHGISSAINTLGRENGFFKNAAVKIPVPESLKTVEVGLRMIRQDAMADEFILTLNRAAEQAVPAAADVFANALAQMTIKDASAILNGGDDAATQYFQRTSENALIEKMRPIVSQATDKAGVTASYKKLMKSAGPLAGVLGRKDLDLETYITGKALDAMFKMIASEEKSIRQNPAARTTELLKMVFGKK